MSNRLRRRLILSVIGFVIAVVVLALVTLGPARDREVSNLGTDTIDFRTTGDGGLDASIARDGPVLFPDPLGGDRSVWIQHLGEGPEVGWYVFTVASPAGPECLTEWDATRELFVDCEGTEFPADGTGLDQFPVEIDGSIGEFDLNFAARAELESETEDDS